MKTGKTITELAQSLQDLRDNQKDYLVPPNKLANLRAEVGWVENGAKDTPRLEISLTNGKVSDFVPSRWANQQISEYTDVPRAYYDRLGAENVGLLASNINHGFAIAAGLAASKRSSTGRMLRTHGGTLRAMVSSRYRRLDNFDLFEAIAPALIDLGFNPESCELTDRRLYLKCVTPKIEAEIQKGDIVQYGLVVSNSDVGAGSVRVEPLIYRLVCSNGMIANVAMRHAHLGRNQMQEDVEELLSDETKALSDRAFWNQVRDVVRNFARPEFFEAEVNKLREAAKQPIRLFDLPEIVERTTKAINVSVGERVKKSILDNLASGADGAGLNKWGLANAFTFAAHDEALDYEQATELERAGAQVVELSPRNWEAINAAK